MKAKTVNYVNNTDLLKAILQYKKECRLAKREGTTKPKIPEYVGKCLLLIAEKLSHKLNFSAYTFRDEMVGDAIENCCMYFDNFDPKKSKNPFAYFTQITYYAFLRRIHKEKRQLYAKYKATEQLGVLGAFEETENEDGSTSQFELYDNIAEYIGKYEASKKHKKKKEPKKRGLDAIVVEKDLILLRDNQTPMILKDIKYNRDIIKKNTTPGSRLVLRKSKKMKPILKKPKKKTRK